MHIRKEVSISRASVVRQGLPTLDVRYLSRGQTPCRSGRVSMTRSESVFLRKLIPSALVMLFGFTILALAQSCGIPEWVTVTAALFTFSGALWELWIVHSFVRRRRDSRS